MGAAGYNTQGFGVTVMPTVATVDAKINPEAVNEGILSAYKVANDVEKYQAFKAVNAELAALREDREAAAHATFQNKASQALADISLRPQQTANTAFADATVGMAQPDERTLKLALLSNQVQQQPDILDMSNKQLFTDRITQDDKLTAQLDDSARLQAEAQGNLSRVDTAQKTADDNASIAASAAENTLATQPMQQAVSNEELEDKFKNAKTDREFAQAGKALQQRLIQAQINQANAKAQYDLGTGRQFAGSAGRDTSLKDLSTLQMQEDKIMKSPIGDGLTTVAVYRGKLLSNPGMDHDAIGDHALMELHDIDQQQAYVRSRLRDATREAQAADAAAKLAKDSVGYRNPAVEMTLPGSLARPSPTAPGNPNIILPSLAAPVATEDAQYDVPATEVDSKEPPTLTPAQASALPPGTRFKTSDGRILIRQ